MTKKIAIGPSVNNYGGVYQYLKNIEKHSENQISILPNHAFVPLIKWIYPTRSIYSLVNSHLNITKYDIIHTNVNPWFCELGRMLQEKKKATWIHTYHTIYFSEDYQHGLTGWQSKVNDYLTNVCRRADIKISVSRWLQSHLRENYDIETLYIPNAFDIGNVTNFISGENQHKKTAFIFVGGNQEIKRPEWFVRLARYLPNHEFSMIGNGLSHRFIERLTGSSVPPNLQIKGKQNHENTMRLMRESDALVMTSKREGFPTVLLEAIALNKKVIIPKHSGCEEIGKNYANAYFFQSFDDLVDVAGDIAGDQRLSTYSNQEILESYSWKRVIKKIDEIYSRS